MALDIKDWSTTAADNDDADAGINWLEGQAPSTVNGSARGMMAAIKSWWDQSLGGVSHYSADTGAADAYVLTPAPAITAYAAGQCFGFFAANANTGASTVNINGLGTKAIQLAGAALTAGDITAGYLVWIMYDGTQFQMLPQSASVTWTLTSDLNLSTYAFDDANGNEQIKFSATASAVNEVTFTNAATGNAPSIKASGDDTNIDLLLTGKATGNVLIGDGTDPTKLASFELSGATTAKTVTFSSSHTDNRTITFPDATATLAGLDTAQTMTQKNMQDYSVENASASSSSGTLTLDYTNGPSFTTTLTENVTTLTINNWPASGTEGKITLYVNQDATGGRTFAWGSIIWAGGTAPTVTSAASSKDVFVLTTIDGGTTIYGYTGGQAFS